MNLSFIIQNEKFDFYQFFAILFCKNNNNNKKIKSRIIWYKESIE